MDMRRPAPIRALAAFLALTGWLLVAFDEHEVCRGEGREYVCEVVGDDGERPPRPPPPRVRYLVDNGECWYWSRYDVAGAIDAWDPGNEDLIYDYVQNGTRCEWDLDDTDRAWEIFRSFPLTTPAPTLEPVDGGITGMPSYLASPNPARIYHVETLPDTVIFEVRAYVVAMTVDWGDGWVTNHDVTDAVPWPTGTVTHVYTQKTCDPEYRETHPSGGLCHPFLEAYPITATYTWWGEYRIGPAWVPIGVLDLSATVPYDIDDIVGVLIPND